MRISDEFRRKTFGVSVASWMIDQMREIEKNMGEPIGRLVERALIKEYGLIAPDCKKYKSE